MPDPSAAADEATAPAPLLIGAYAALPDPGARDSFYRGLAGSLGARGLEIPTQHLLADEGGSVADLARVLAGRFRESAVTAIPGTMRHVGADPRFGLASRDEEGRGAALAYTASLLRAADAVNQRTGEPSISRVLLHSAPTGHADAEAFARSLDEVSAPPGIALVIEHCDAADDRVPGEKRFLPWDRELEIARSAGLGVTVNWGRSVVESHDPGTPRAQVEEAARAGVLTGLMFSGAGGEQSQYGGPWADAHLPLRADEPTSAMGESEVHECLEAAGRLAYVGVKVQTPGDADVPERLAIIGRVVAAIRGRA